MQTPDTWSKEQTCNHCPLSVGRRGEFICPLAGPPGACDQVRACLVSLGIRCWIHLGLIKTAAAARSLTRFEPGVLNVFMWRLSLQAPGLCRNKEVPLLLLPLGSPIARGHLWGGATGVGMFFCKWGLLSSLSVCSH